jgi:uncharacterized membrane-anchored protein
VTALSAEVRSEEAYNDAMAWTVDDALRALRENAEKARQLRIELTDDYLAMIDYLERLPENQPGSHKIDHWQGTRRYLEAFKHAKLTPRL